MLMGPLGDEGPAAARQVICEEYSSVQRNQRLLLEAIDKKNVVIAAAAPPATGPISPSPRRWRRW